MAVLHGGAGVRVAFNAESLALPPEVLAAFHPIGDDRAVRTAIGLAG